VRNDDEWDWLRSLLTIPKIQSLLDEEYVGGAIERFEIPGIRAGKAFLKPSNFISCRWILTLVVVHFLVRDHLDRGFNSTSTYDTLGKNVGEYLRAKWVDIPNKFLARGRF
jgi:hypothetical protein